MKTPAHVLPADIERSSMAIITKELEQRGVRIPEEQRAVVLRAIHTTADFDYAENLRFTEGALTRSLAYLRSGSPVIITDANMSLAGISKPSLEKLGGSLYCFTGDPAIREAARENGTTRAAAGIAYAADNYPDAVFVIGNAPTALFHLADRIGKGLRPALVIGVPVGFVNVCESKEEILAACTRYEVPAVVAMGRKGGSNVAAAIMNALLYTATDMVDPAKRGWQG